MGSEQLIVEDPALPRITMNVSSISFSRNKLMKFWDDLPQRKKEQCIERYGRLHEFIDFNTNWDMIRALLWVWDSSRRCFIINGEDCTPTIEEYQAIFRCTIAVGNDRIKFKPYRPEQKIKPWRKLGQILDVQIPEYPGIEEFHGINLDQLLNLRDTAVEKIKSNKKRKDIPKDNRDEDDPKMHAFLIAIFGTVIFPNRKDVVDEGIFELMHKLTQFELNPIMGILAETFSTLNRLKEKRCGTFTACAPLLQVWAYYRFMHCQPKRNLFTVSTPILEAGKLPMEQVPENIEAWKNYFKAPRFFNWLAPFMLGHMTRDYLHHCGGYAWVPLIGPYTIISCAPSLVLRQYEVTQILPAIEGLESFHYRTGSDWKLISKLNMFWREQ
jgi:hypothetical protein